MVINALNILILLHVSSYLHLRGWGGMFASLAKFCPPLNFIEAKVRLKYTTNNSNMKNACVCGLQCACMYGT